MPVDSNPNDGITGRFLREGPIATSNIARNMQESLQLKPVPLLVVVIIL